MEDYKPMEPATREIIQNLRADGQKQRERIAELHRRAMAADSEKKKQKMQREIEIEANLAAAAAAESVRKKYRQEHPATWNEGRNEIAFRSLVAKIRGGQGRD